MDRGKIKPKTLAPVASLADEKNKFETEKRKYSELMPFIKEFSILTEDRDDLIIYQVCQDIRIKDSRLRITNQLLGPIARSTKKLIDNIIENKLNSAADYARASQVYSDVNKDLELLKNVIYLTINTPRNEAQQAIDFLWKRAELREASTDNSAQVLGVGIGVMATIIGSLVLFLLIDLLVVWPIVLALSLGLLLYIGVRTSDEMKEAKDLWLIARNATDPGVFTEKGTPTFFNQQLRQSSSPAPASSETPSAPQAPTQTDLEYTA